MHSQDGTSMEELARDVQRLRREMRLYRSFLQRPAARYEILRRFRLRD